IGFVQIDAIFFEQKADAARELLGRGSRACDHLLEVKTDFADVDSMLTARSPDRLHRLSRAEQSLRRDAAPVGTHPARAVALDYRDFHFQLAGANRGNVAAGSGADYHQVVAGVCQAEILFGRARMVHAGYTIILAKHGSQ